MCLHVALSVTIAAGRSIMKASGAGSITGRLGFNMAWGGSADAG